METTVTTPVSDRLVKDDKDLRDWANKEVVPVLKELRQAANQVTSSAGTSVTAGDGSWQTLWQSEAISEGSRIYIEAVVMGWSEDETVIYRRAAGFHNLDGTLLQIGSTQTPVTLESASGPDVRFTIVGLNVVLEVNDDSGGAFDWKHWVDNYGPSRP